MEIIYKYKEVTMEALQKQLVAIISKQLEAENKNIQLLDVLNRLLGTVNSWIFNLKQYS